MFIKIAQFFLSLTILITLHELGHFLFAKKFKCRVDKFYLFFDFLFPFASVMNFSLFKKKIGDTEYGIGWFPLGGYVQIAGMVDEQMDKSLIDTPPQPWELRSKPAWQRLLVMMGGIIVNIVLGVVIFWGMLVVWGKQTVPMTNIPEGLTVDSAAYYMGLRNGDYITALDHKPVTDIKRIPVEIIMNGISSVQGVHATGEKFSLPVDDGDRSRILKLSKRSLFVAPRYRFKVDSAIGDSYAANANLQRGDHVISVNGKRVHFFDEFRAELLKAKSKTATLQLLRGKDTVFSTSKVSDEGAIGLMVEPVVSYRSEVQKFNIFNALSQGITDGIELIVMNARQIVVLITVKDAHQQVGGFYTMVQHMASEWDWRAFWAFTGFLSLALAFMNFLPIPMLDGGYIMFILWEMVTGRKVSDKVIYYANNVGLFIVLSLMIYANTDWLRN